MDGTQIRHFTLPSESNVKTSFEARASQSSECVRVVYLETLVNPASAPTWAPDPGCLQWAAGLAFWYLVLCGSQELHLENCSCGFINGLPSDVTSVHLWAHSASICHQKSMLSSPSTSASITVKVYCINIPYHHQILSEYLFPLHHPSPCHVVFIYNSCNIQPLNSPKSKITFYSCFVSLSFEH